MNEGKIIEIASEPFLHAETHAILAAQRRGGVGLEQAQASAVSDDYAAQVRVLESLSGWQICAIKATFDWLVQSWTGPASSVTLLRDGRYTSFKDRLVPGTDATGWGNRREGCGAFFSTNSRT